MKTTNKVLLTTIAVSLIACGGGGSSSSKGSKLPTTRTPIKKLKEVQENTEANAKKKVDEVKKSKDKIATNVDKKIEETKNTVDKKTGKTESGRELVVFKYPQPADPIAEVRVASDGDFVRNVYTRDVNILRLKSSKITLIPPNTSAKGFFKLDSGENKRVVSGVNYNSRFGIISFTDSKGTTLRSFSQGIVISGLSSYDLPETGKFIYQGQYLSANAITNDFASIQDGKITFEVNFADKIVNGDIVANKDLEFKSILKGNISGKDFKSKSGDFKGFFYGEDAYELGGIAKYKKGSEKTTIAFGAKKQ